MVEGKTRGLDVNDRKIIYELDRNSRQSFSSVGKKVRLSKEVVNYRVKRLQELGVLKGFYTVIDLAKLGYDSYRVYFKLTETSPEKQAEIIEHFRAKKGVWWLCSFMGEWDIAFATWARNNYDFGRIWQAVLERYRGNITNEKVAE